MARKVLILGPSGSGKSYSLKNMNPKETFYICPDDKELMFKGGEKNYKTVYDENNKVDIEKSNRLETTDMGTIQKVLESIHKKRTDVHNVVIDTITSAMTEDFMSRAEEKGWEKFTQMAKSPYKIFKRLRKLRDDLNIFIMAHSETIEESGTKMFIPGGKLLKEKAIPEASFSIVLETVVTFDESSDEPQHYFRTYHKGDGVAKAPQGMFDSYLIPNDLQYVLDCMYKYYDEA